MRKRNKTKQLGRTSSHRKAMLRNMAVSLFEHERIITSRAKSKVLKSYSEKLITRAKRNLESDVAPETVVHNKRLLMGTLDNRKILTKLCEDIAPRFKERKGGYTRIIHLPDRLSDGAKMSVIELVDRKEKKKKEIPAKKKATKTKSTEATTTKKQTKAEPKKSESAAPEQSKKGDGKKGKWFWGFKKKKGDEH